jgi:hypothetical protein
VIADYSLRESTSTGAGAAASGLTLDSATELDGVVTLKLGGKVKVDYVLKASGTAGSFYEGQYFQPTGPGSYYWVDETTKPAAGTYAGVYIQGLFDWTENADPKVLAIKNTNQALRLYTGVSGLLEAAPEKPKVTDTSNSKTIHIPGEGGAPVKWQLHQSIAKGKTLGILIWNGGTGTTYTPKTATLVIQEYDGYDDSVTVGTDTAKLPKEGGYAKTVVVDYSAVNFDDGSLPSLTLSKPTWSNTGTPNAQNVNEMMACLWYSSATSTVQGLTLGKVFSYAAGTKTLTVNKANVTDGLKTWITTQWGGTSVPVKVTLSSGTPSSTVDSNWSSAYLEWIDVATVTAGTKTISLTGGGTESYTIAVTP